MSQPWIILTTRYGSDIQSPSSTQLVAAIDEVVNPAHSDDVEHTETFLRFGYDDGPMYVLGYTASGRMYFEQWNDQDYESELAPPSSMAPVAAEEALAAMHELARGEVDMVKARPWICDA